MVMKIKKILICIITIIFVMSFTVSYGATNKQPASSAKQEQIVEYLKSNKITAEDLTSDVSISKLSNWYKKLSKVTSTENAMYEKMIKNALEDKSKSEINTFVNSKSKSDLEDFEPKEVFSEWKDKINNKNKKDIIEEIIVAQTDTVIDPTESPNAYEPGKAESTKIKGIIGPILGAINNVGVVISIIALMLIGVKYMLGSVEEKANYKQTLWPYIIGIFVLFMGSTIPNIIYKTLH